MRTEAGLQGPRRNFSCSKISAFIAQLSVLCVALWALLFARCAFAGAQENRVYRIGVIHQGGPYRAVVDGFRAGLRDLGLQDGKKISLQIRETENDPNTIDEAAKGFERDKVNLIYAITTSAAVPVKNATTQTPIVFAVGTDPVMSGLVQSFAKPGGRLTGVQYSTTDLTAKRLEILKEILPKVNRVLILYNPNNRSSREAAELAHKAANQFRLQLIDRQAASVEELRQQIETIKAKEADAFFYISDAMVNSQAHLVIAMAQSKKLPAMFSEQSAVAMGALASYGQNFQEVGRLSAGYVQKIIGGAQPRDLKIEIVDKLELVINLATAKHIGLTIPPNVLARADRVIK